LDLDEVI